MSSLITQGNSYTGTDLKYTYSGGNYTIKAVTPGKYRIVGLLGSQGASSKLVNAHSDDILATALNTGYAPQSNKYSVVIVYKVSN